jgi:hypothetical protein
VSRRVLAPHLEERQWRHLKTRPRMVAEVLSAREDFTVLSGPNSFTVTFISANDTTSILIYCSCQTLYSHYSFLSFPHSLSPVYQQVPHYILIWPLFSSSLLLLLSSSFYISAIVAAVIQVSPISFLSYSLQSTLCKEARRMFKKYK